MANYMKIPLAVNPPRSLQATHTGNHLVGIKSGGGSEIELFDMKPYNQVTFDTSANTTKRQDHVVITLDVMGENASKKSFVAILNHNLKSAGGKIHIRVLFRSTYSKFRYKRSC